MKLAPGQTLESIAKLINGKGIGNANHAISGINEIHMVEPGDLCFVDHPKYYDKCLNSAATTILINQEVPVPAGKAIIVSDNPFRDYNILVTHFRPFEQLNNNISTSANIGTGTHLQPGVIVGNNVTIGNNCLIHANVVIQDHCVLGNDVVIGAGSIIGGDAFYFKKTAEGYIKMQSCGRVLIEDRVEIGSGCTIDRGVTGDTIIGQGSKLDNQIHIGHDTQLGKNVLIAAQTGIAGVTVIEDDVIIWGQVGINKDLRIGKGAVILAQSGISKSINPGEVFFGSPGDNNRVKLRELAALRQLPEVLAKLGK